MAPSKLKKAIGAVKDRTSIGLAKVSSSASLSDLEVAIVKATRHEQYPPDERHIREILSLTCYCRAFISACVSTISRRLGKTKNWAVAIKSLMLLHRLLLDGDPAYQQEIFFATRRGTRLLNMSDFRDTSRSNAWDYSAFVRTYALYLDEHLEFRMQGRRGKRSAFAFDDDDEEAGPAPARATPLLEMRPELLFSRIHHLMQLMERFLACRPTGPARHDRLVLMALYPVVKESFQIHYEIVDIEGILIDRFTDLEVSDCVRVQETYRRLSKQLEELAAFYGWSKGAGIARSSEYPDVEKIAQEKLDAMDELVRKKSSNQNCRIEYTEKIESEEEDQKSEVLEEDINTTKALPPPEEVPAEAEEEEEEEKKEEAEVPELKGDDNQKEADLLHLGDDTVTTEDDRDKLALALFDGGQPLAAAGTSTSAWEAFKDTENWETALVVSASHLSDQKTALAGGLDMMVLNGMYEHGATAQAMASSGYNATGSASSVAFGSAGRPAALALPAPPSTDGSEAAATGGDPFAASLPVPPPSYVQMSDMEKKQRLLVEEQLMWQQYARDGRQGNAGTKPNPNPMGGYPRSS